jgi:DNA helicase-2/ATP-dependent DNA helicase PcrA
MSMSFPSPEQQSLIYEAQQGKSLLIVSGPGSGKTRTAMAMALQSVRSLPSNSLKQVLFLSFSRAAIARLAASVGIQFSKADQTHLRFMTFHSCAADIVSLYGRFVGLPPVRRVADKLEERLLAIDAGWDEKDPNYDLRLISLAKEKGLLTFSVLLPLATAILSSCLKLKEVLARRYPFIVIDEFQDTSEDQWTFLKQLGARSQVVALGDPNQIIYSSLHQATERRMAEFEEWKEGPADHTLAKNFRCSQGRILEFADCLLEGRCFDGTNSDPVKFGVFYRSELRARLALLWKQIQDKIGSGQTIGILLPSNALVEEVAAGLRNPPVDSSIRFPVYVQMARDEAAYDAVLLAIAAIKDFSKEPTALLARKASIALLAMNSSWDSRCRPSRERIKEIAEILMARKLGDGSALSRLLERIQLEPDLSSICEIFIAALDGLPAFGRAAKRLIAHPRLVSLQIRGMESQSLLFDQLRGSRSPKGLHGDEGFEGKTHVITYHKAKGREFDYVVMVVDPRQESTRTSTAEKQRLYYVCATRARKWLGVVYFGADHGVVLGPVLHKVTTRP